MKVRRISEFQTRISYPAIDNHLASYQSAFLDSELGQIHRAIPWDDLVSALGLRGYRKGPEAIFSPKGKLALMFLKNYSGCSDHKLIEQFNGNIYYQLFCDTLLDPGFHLKNFKIVSQIRCELAEKLNIPKLEEILMDKWRPYMSSLNSVTCDATCYESSIRYPTDAKLLFECVMWMYKQVCSLSKKQKVRKPRTKIKKWTARAISYSKMKRKTKKKRRSLTRGLLRLLEKLNSALIVLEAKEQASEFTNQYQQRRATIEKILSQQSDKFYHDQTPQGAIVSIDKPYIRPIVRGKEIKKVEFGAKLHKLQIDGISFIEHLSYDAFHEGNRLINTIYRAQKLTRTKVKLLGADAIYATNANRTALTKSKIQTDFKPKGRQGSHAKHKNQLKMMITKERASRLEGSFGTDKEYFLLNRIKARTEKTETLWIFIGIHTSNALNIGKRMAKSLAQAA